MAKGGTKKSVSADKAEFFKVFLPDLHSHQLMIPPDYVKYFSRTIRERVMLKDAAGKIWHVSVEKTRDGVFLKNGWQRFVNHHLLSLGEFLVFKYDKSFSFLVKIYGINACKKENLAANIDDITTRVKVEENFSANIDDITTRVKVEEHDTEENDTKEEMNEKQTMGKRKETNISFDSYECPSFMSPIVRYQKPYQLEIPKGVRDNVDIESEMVLRDAKGKEWDVHIRTCSDGRVFIGKGWFQFRVDNDLGPEDRCKLTFGAENSSSVIRVQVLRDVSCK